MLNFCLEASVVLWSGILSSFHQHGQIALGRMPGKVCQYPQNPAALRCQSSDDVLYGGGKYINASHDEHIVSSSYTANHGTGPTAFAFGVQHVDVIAASKTQQR